MKILVVGAGAQGSAATSILSRDNNVEQVILGDINGDVARAAVDNANLKKMMAGMTLPVVPFPR